MLLRASLCASAFLLVPLFAAGCDDNGGAAALSYGSITAPSSVGSNALIVRPASVVPNFVATPVCANRSPFVVKIDVTVKAERDVSVRVVTFELVDPFGLRTFPDFVTSTAVPVSMPVPLPSSLPIPVPGTLALGGMSIRGGSSQTLPLSLRFGCGVIPIGNLLVGVEASGSDGAIESARTSVRIAG